MCVHWIRVLSAVSTQHVCRWSSKWYDAVLWNGYSIVLCIFQTRFHAIAEHTHTNISLYFSIHSVSKFASNSGQSRREKKATTAESFFPCVVFRSHPWHFDGSRKCLLTHFLFFYFILWWIACESIVVGCWRVYDVYVPVFLFQNRKSGHTFPPFQNSFRIFYFVFFSFTIHNYFRY